MRSISMIAAVLALAMLASAQDEDLSKVKMKVIKVSASVYMLQGDGGNIGASVGEDAHRDRRR